MDSSARSRKKQVQSLEKQIRRILLAWNPLARGLPVPADEYDCLVHQIVSSRFQRRSKEQLRELIARELIHHFGLPDALPGVDAVVDQVFALPSPSSEDSA